MHGFVSHYTNKLDAKGRVSIPAPFRSVLSRDGFDGLYCILSAHADAVDAGGNELMQEIEGQLGNLQALTADHDMLSFAFFGASEILKIDSEGRVVLTDTLRDHAHIDGAVTFVGLRYKFQIWEPERFRAQRAEAMKRAFGVLGAKRAETAG